MKPYYDDGKGIVIYHGDCREILPQLGPVDLVLTDPPYGVGLQYANGETDSVAAFCDLAQWLAGLSAATCFTVPSTRLFNIPKPDWIGVWYKPMAMGFWNTLLYPHWEAIIFYRFVGKLGRDDVWVYNPTKPNGHPCPKPIDM
jgi:hypothetical protein